MEFKQIKYLEQDLEKINSILKHLKENLRDNPDDFSIKTDIQTFEGRYKQVSRELTYIKKLKKMLKFLSNL